MTAEGEAAGDEVLVEQAVESRAARGADKRNIKMLKEKCNKNPNLDACKRLTERRRGRKNSRNARKNKNKKATRKSNKANKKGRGEKKKGRKAKKKGEKKGKNKGGG